MKEGLVVLSFPGPDHSIKMADLRRGKGVSRRYRNRRIGEFLKELDLTEGRSTGISKILKAMKANGSPVPEFETDKDRTYFLIRLPLHPGALQEEPTPKSSEKILSLLQKNGDLSAVSIAAQIGISSRAVEKHLSNLQKTGKLKRIGPDKGGHWEVRDK
jgi:ATP-dependent DNA helicase RecG